MCEPVRQCDLVLHPLRMRIEHWELSIGQVPGRIQGSGFCQVIFARALSMVCATAINARFKPRFVACV